MLLKNKKPSSHQGRRLSPRYHPGCILPIVRPAGVPLSFAITGEPASSYAMGMAFTTEVCPWVQGRQTSSALVLLGHSVGLTPLSPGSLKDGLILLPRLSSGPRGIRTLGLLNAIETRSQLRYGPKNVARIVPVNPRIVNQKPPMDKNTLHGNVLCIFSRILAEIWDPRGQESAW
jgi:hypothetical protein